jgi:hypothetical protein
VSIGDAHLVHCDFCATTAWFDATIWAPQEGLVYLTRSRGWTSYGDISHCGDCPPLCPRCGAVYDGNAGVCPDCTHGQG